MATDHNFRIKNGLEVGGQLIVNSSGQLVVATVSSQLQFLDNVKAKFGNGSDLQIYHDGTDSHIQNTQNNGVLRIRSQETYFVNSDNNETQARFIENGAVTLYHNNASKLETTSGGVNVLGNILDIGGANPYIRGTHASAMRIKHTSGQTMYIRPDESGAVSFFEGSTGGSVYLTTQSPTVNDTTNDSTPLYFITRSKKADGTTQSKTAQIRHRTTNISTNNTELLFSSATNYRMDAGLWIGSTSGAHVYLGDSGGIEIARTAGGADPYIDFKDSASDDYDVRLQMDDNKFIIKTGGAGNIVTAATFDNNGRLYLDGQTSSYLDYNSTYLRHSTPYGYIEMGPGNAAHAHLMTDRPNFYFNKEIQVDTGIIGSHNENLTLRRAQNSATGQLILQEGKFIGTGQTTSDLLNSSMIIGGFTANTGFEEAGNHFYIPGLSPNNLAGADRRLTVTITKNGSAYSPSSIGNMFTSTGSFAGFSHAAGTTDTIVITITGGQLNYAQYYGVQFGHPSFRAKSIEIENSTDSGANWTSVYDVADFPHSTVNHYHGGSGTSVNAIRYTFTDFASTGMRINQLFAYDYSESITHNLESYVDSTINANYRWNDGYRAKFGSSDDLQIYHSGTHSFIQDTGVGSLYLDTSGLIVRNPSNNANVLIATPTDVQLFAGGGTAKLQTASWGVLVNGILNADGLHIGAGASDLISVRNDSTTTQIATYRNELGGFITRTYGDHGNDGTLVEYQERVGADGNYVSIGTHGAHALQIRTGNSNRLDISSTGKVEVQGTGNFIAPTIGLTNNSTDTAAHRVSVYDNDTTSYGMMLWNDNGTSGDWATMIYGPAQTGRKISFGKINNTTSFTNHSHVDEIAYFDLDNQNLYLTDGTLFANGASDGVVARKGTFGPSITALHGTYDLYNNGTTYLNGATIVDAPLTVSDASSGIKVDSSGHASVRIDRGGASSHNNLLYYTNGTLDWRIWQSNATHLRIRDEGDYPSNMMSFQSATASGNSKVGIHTDSPEFPVHIQGSVDGDFNVGIFNTKSYGTGTGTNETATLSLGIKEASSTAASRIFGQIRVATLAESSSATGKMTFHVRDGGTVTERATLSAAGNLNIDGGLYTSHINTGQGNTEVHLMNQNLRTTDSPTFATLNVTGDLNITGDINTVSVTDLDVVDKTITVSAGAASSSAADESGLIIGGAGSKILWDHAEDKFQFSHGINFDRDTYSETNQNLGVYWSGWDKETGGDQTDIAYIRHTEAVGGHSNSVLEIKSMNDSGDGIAFTTHASSALKHNSSNILTAANFTTNITNLLTTTTTFGGDVDGTYNSLVIDVPTQTSAPTASTGRLWWDSTSGNLKIYNGSVWVTASAIPDVSTKYDKTGGAISGSVSITSTLAVSGTITGSSTVQGATIVKTGGTSSQFLKADGSVDSSTYLTGNQTITLTGDASGSGTTTIPVVVANDSHNHSSSSGNFSVGGTLFVPQKIEHTSDSNTYMEFDAGDQWRVVTGGVERIRVIGGAVGIGDIDPTDGDLTLNTPQLHVKGPDTSSAFNLVARFQGGSDSDNTGGAILINHSNDRGLLIEGGRSSSDRGVGYIGLLNSGADHTRIMGFYQDGTTYTAGINIDPGTYPHTDLQVGNPETGSTGITIASRYDQSAAKLTFRTGHPTTTNIWNTTQITSTDDGNYNGRLEFRTSTSGQAAPSTKMFIRANGTVGIGSGVFTPGAQLHVKSVGATYGSGSIAAVFEDTTARATVRIRSIAAQPAELFFDSGGATRWDFSTRGSSESYRLDLYGQHSTPSYTAVAGPWITVLQSGNVGINDANPGNKLEVNEATNYKGIHVRGSNAPQITFGRGTNSAAEWKAGIAGSNGASFSISTGTGNQDRLHIESNGETGIGTSAPDALLEVNGSFKAKTVMLSGAQNFDNLAKSGFYNIYNGLATGHTNAPFQYGSMLVVGNNKASGGFTMQLAHERTGGGTFIRGMNDSGATWYSWQRIFQDNYHPNADKWTTSRSHTVTLTGAVTGTATQGVDGTGNRTWTISTAYNGAYSETDTLATVTGRGATTTTQSSFNSGIITQANGIRLARTQANSSIWFNGGSATDANHVLWNAGYGTTPTSRPGTSGAFDGIMWNTYRGIKLRGGLSGAYNLIVAENSSGSTNDHTVKLYASNVKRFETTTTGAVIENTLLLGSYTDAAKQGTLVLGGNVANKQAVLKCTNGNLHMDADGASATYLNYYTGSAGTAFGTGASGVAAWMGPDGDLWKGSADNTGSRYFNDGYHPNADKWTTPRTLSLSGDASGSVSWDGSANVTLSVAISNDSHNHDHSDGGFVVNGDLNTQRVLVDGKVVLDLPSSSTERGPWNPIITSMRNSGRRLYADEDFRDGTNAIGVYNNTAGSTVTITRELASVSSGGTAPNSSGYVLKVNHNGGSSSPGFGGFIQTIPSEDNHTFVQIFQAKLRTGSSFASAENQQGTNNTTYWLSNTAGTGKWEWYARVSHCGDSGTFAGGGHVYTSGGSGNFSYHIANCTVIDVTEPVHGEISVFGNIHLEGDPTTSNQSRTIDFTGFDKEGVTDFSDRAYISHTTNTGGHTGAVLEISSQNDIQDGIAFTTHGSSSLKHNSSNILTASNFSSNITTIANATNATNADTVDSLHAASFLRSDANDTATGDISFNGQLYFNSDSTSNYTEGVRLNRSTSGWGGATFGGVRNSVNGITEAWWVARNPSKNLVLAYGTSADSGGLSLPHNTTALKYKNQQIFRDDYHPNADVWTTARSHTVTLTGDVTGTATQSVNGSGNHTWTITTAVGNNSHSHDNIVGGTTTNLNTSFTQRTPDRGLYSDRFSSSATNNPASYDNANAVLNWYSHGSGGTGSYGKQIATVNNSAIYFRNVSNGGFGSWQRIFADDYHPNADVWTTARTATVTLTGDATGTAGASVNGSGDWTNSIAVTVNNIDGQAFINTRSNSAQSVQGVDGNGIYYYSSGTDNFSGNASDGAAYQQSYSTSWRHTINGDYRSGAIAVKSRNNGTWQETKRIPMIFTGSTTPTITTHADNCELWFDTSVGKLKFYHNDGTTAAWVDAVAVPSISNLYSKGGGTISGSVSILNTLNVVGITELDNELFVDKLAGANGTSNQIARFSNITSGATSGYIYLGASAGTDWKVGKNVAGTAGSSQFDIATHTNALALSVNVSRGIIVHTGSVHSDTAFAFLTVGSGAQDIRTKSVFAGTSYGDTPPAGSFNATNTYEQNGTTVIDASKNLQNIAAINLSGQINFNGTTYKVNPYEQSNYRGGTTSARRGLNFYHSVGPQMTLWYDTPSTGVGNLKIFCSNTGVGDTFQFTTGGDFHAKGNITAYSTTTTSDARLKENVRDLEGSLDKTLKLRGVKFDWIDESKSKDNLGFIAQEVEEVIPEIVEDITNIDGEEHKVVNYQAVVPVLVEAIKEQQNLINKLEARLNELEKSMEKK
jgi:hypothetical protein